MRTPRTMLIAALAAAALALTGCGTSDSDSEDSSTASGPGAGQSITVGNADFGENQVLAEVYAQKLRADGFTVESRQIASREVIEPALENGDLDVVPEYLATITDFLNVKQNGEDAPNVISADAAATREALTPLAEKAGLVFYDYAEAQDKNSYVVTSEFATANMLRSVSDLAAYSQQTPITMAGTPECRQRPQCQLGLQELYGVVFTDDYVNIDLSGFQGRMRLESGDVQMAVFLSSDGGLDDTLTVLEDDKGLNAADNIIPAVNAEAATPELQTSLNAIHASLGQDQLIELNRKVVNERMPAAAVAQTFLADNNLIPAG